MRWSELDGSLDSAQCIRDGIGTVFLPVGLGSWRDRPLDGALFDALEARLTELRDVGMTAIVRFRYAEQIGEVDAPLAMMLHHIRQLGPVLERHVASLAAVQAGFIGLWGEWHGSKWGVDGSSGRRAVLAALLDAVPDRRTVLVRTPRYKRDALGSRGLSEREALGFTPRARVGFHDDALFHGADHMGTFEAPIARDRNWLSQEARWVPVVGESAGLAGHWTDGEQALKTIEALRVSLLSDRWHPDVLAGWRASGHLEAIGARLGYRLRVDALELPERWDGQGTLDVSLRVVNDGVAAPFVPRPVQLVLRHSAGWTQFATVRGVDCRRWLPAGRYPVRVRLPGSPSIGSGALDVGLRIPSDVPAVAAQSRRCLPLRGKGRYDAGSGTLWLGRTVVMRPAGD